MLDLECNLDSITYLFEIKFEYIPSSWYSTKNSKLPRWPYSDKLENRATCLLGFAHTPPCPQASQTSPRPVSPPESHSQPTSPHPPYATTAQLDTAYLPPSSPHPCSPGKLSKIQMSSHYLLLETLQCCSTRPRDTRQAPDLVPQPVAFHPCRHVQPHIPSALRLPRLSPAAWPPLSTTHCRDSPSTWDVISFLPCCQRAHWHLTRVNKSSLPPTPAHRSPRPSHNT